MLKLAWRELVSDKLLWGLSAAAVALGVAVVVSGDIVKAALLRALTASDDARMMWAGMTDQLEANLTAIGLAISIAAGFIVFNAFSISVARRRQRLATLRVVGMTRAQVLGLALTEALAVGGGGAALGLATAPALGRLTIAAITAVTPEGLLVFLPGPADGAVTLRAAGLGLAISLLASVAPARQATRVSPIAAQLRPEPSEPKRPAARIGAVAAAGMLAIALVLRLAPPAARLEPPWDLRLALLTAGIWMSLIVLLASASATVAGERLRPVLRRLAGPTGMLVADHLKRDPGRVTLTVVSLALALALVVGLAGFTHFTFEFLMRPVIDRASGLGAWVITRMDPLQGMSAYQTMQRITLLEAEVERARALIGDRAVVTEIRYAQVPELSFFGDSFFSHVVRPEEADAASDWLFEFEQGDWQAARREMQAGCGVLVIPAVASELGARYGDVVGVTGASGRVQCTLAGIGSAFMTGTVIGAADPGAFDATGTMFMVVIPQLGVDRHEFERDLEALRPELTLTVMDEVTVASNQLVEQIPLVFDGMAVLAVLAAGLGVVNTLVAGVVERRGELGLFRAVGATRRQLRAVVAAEAALISALGAAIGILAGAGLAVIAPTVYGGGGWGIRDLDHWSAAMAAVRSALPIGAIGWLGAVAIGGLAGLLTAQTLLRRRGLVAQMQAERH